MSIWGLLKLKLKSKEFGESGTFLTGTFMLTVSTKLKIKNLTLLVC